MAGNSNITNIPTLEQLQAYNVNRPGDIEGIRSSLYDFQTYPQAGSSKLTFFQTPQGQAGKTLVDTNMETAGSLPAPKRFLVESIEVYFFPGSPVATFGAQAAALNVQDCYELAQSGYLDFYIGSKSYLQEAPIGRFPPSNGLSVSAAVADATTAAADSQTLVDYARFGGMVYRMDPPILLVPTQNFNVSLNWTTPAALNSAGRIGVVMKGILYRNSQ